MLAGLAVMAFGVALSIVAGLGTSPISSLPYVASRVFPVSVGLATILMNAVFVLIQIALLGRRYRPLQLLQVPVALLFGVLIDLCLWLLRGVDLASYLEQWAWCLAGVVVVGVAVAMMVIADVVVLAGEGVVLAVRDRLHWARVTHPLAEFGALKVLFDVTLVGIASILSLLVLHELVGVREGTVAAALGVGVVARWVVRAVQPGSERGFREPTDG